MQFTLKDHVKLATKGYKLNDIAELSEIDDSKFDKDDIMALVGSGYKMADIKKLVEAFKDPEDDADDKQGIDDQDQEKSTQSAQGRKKSSNDNNSDDEDDPDDKESIIDYKEAYEKEKKLREKLQQNNVNSLQGSGSGQTKTDEELAIELAEKILR